MNCQSFQTGRLFQIQSFLQFVKNIYKELPNHMPKIFEPRAQIKVKDISELNIETTLQEIFSITPIMTEKKNQDNQPITVSIVIIVTNQIVASKI